MSEEIIKRLSSEEQKNITDLSKERQKSREIEKIIDNKIEDAIIKIFNTSNDKKEILKFVKGNRFDINGEDFTNLKKYMDHIDRKDISPYKEFSADLTNFKNEIIALNLTKIEKKAEAVKDSGVEADKHLNEVLSTYDNIKFLADDDTNLDDINGNKNITKFKKADAVAFGGSKNLLAQLGKFKDRAGESIFVSKIVEKFNKTLEEKKINKIFAINILELKNIFMNEKGPKLVKTDIKVDGKIKTSDVSMTSLFVDSISPFTGNLDRYFDIGENISEKYKEVKLDIANNAMQAALGLNIMISENPETFQSEYSNYLKNQRPNQKEEIKKQAKETKDKDTKKKLEEYAKSPNAIYFNGLVLGYMQHYHTATLQSLGNKNEVTKEVSGTTKADIFTIGASAGAQITKNLTVILGGNVTYSGGKITPGANIGLSENLGKGFSASINAGTLITNLQNVSLLVGLSKRFNLSDGSNKLTANIDLNLFAGVDALHGFIPQAGFNIDRNKMLGIANGINDLRTGLTIAISEAISQGKDKQYIVDKLAKGSGNKKGFEAIDAGLAKELIDHIYPVIETLDKIDAKTPEEKLQLNIYIQENITDNLLTEIATGKFKSSNKFGRGGVSFSTNDLLGLGVPFLVRVLGTSIKKNNVKSTTKEIIQTKAETRNEKFGKIQVDALNKHFLRNDIKDINNKFYISDWGTIIVPKDIKIIGKDGKEITEREVNTKKHNISVDKNGIIRLSDSNNEAKHIDIRLLNERLKGSFTIIDKGDSLTFIDKNKKETIISKESVKTDGIKINTKELSVIVNPDTDKKPGQIDKIEITDTSSSIKIDLPLSESYKTDILAKILNTNNQKTADGQKLTYDIKYSDHKLYESFSTEMKSEDTNYVNAARLANDLLEKYNAKNKDKAINHNFEAGNKNDLLSLFVALISYEYAVGKVNNENFDINVNALVEKLPNGLKAGLNVILSNKTQSLHEYKIGNQTALERAKANLSKNHKELYLKLLTVGDIATQSVFKRVDNTWIGSRENMVKNDPRGFGKRMIYYTNESLKLVGNKKNYESEIIPIGFVLGYPGEKLAANLEVIKGSKIKIGNNSEDEKLRKYAFENLVKNVPELANLDLNKATIDKDGNMIIDINTKISVDTLDFGLYAHCNGNHSVLATGLKITRTTKKEVNESILTGYGDLKIEDSKVQTKVSGESKGVLDIVGGIISSKSTTTIKTGANDETMKTGANDILGKEIKVTINGVEKTVKIIEMTNSGGKLQMAVVGSATPEVYTLTPDGKGTITINGKTYIATKNNTSTPTTGNVTGIPSSGSNSTPVAIIIPSNSGTKTPVGPITNIPTSPTGPINLKSENGIPDLYNMINANHGLAEEKIEKIDKSLQEFILNHYENKKQ